MMNIIAIQYIPPVPSLFWHSGPENPTGQAHVFPATHHPLF